MASKHKLVNGVKKSFTPAEEINHESLEIPDIQTQFTTINLDSSLFTTLQEINSKITELQTKVQFIFDTIPQLHENN